METDRMVARVIVVSAAATATVTTPSRSRSDIAHIVAIAFVEHIKTRPRDIRRTLCRERERERQGESAGAGRGSGRGGREGCTTVCFHIIRNLETMHD